ncbi:MAG: PAS domain S-box protein, partial [Desulfobacteraceae bacterium]|nr:PAS domain S-box protein [Desulfobacteraceae bacterium]
MELIDKIRESWKAFERKGLPSSAWTSDKLSFWRERILFIIILLVIVFGFIRLIPITILSYLEGQWLIAGLALLAWFAAVFILYRRNLPIAYRTWILYLIFYMFGISLLHFFGLASAGHDWFFRASVIVGIILGMRAAIVALSFNLILLLLIAVTIFTDSSVWVSQDTNTLKLWLVVMVNSMISNTIITFVIVLLFDGVDDLLFKSQETVNTLRESEERLKGTFEASPDPMVVYDVDGYPQYLNSAFIEVFGWTMEELAGKRIPFVPKEQQKICKQQIDQLFRTGSSVELETRRITRKGTIIDVLLKAAIIRDSLGKPMGTIVNLADIT